VSAAFHHEEHEVHEELRAPLFVFFVTFVVNIFAANDG